MNQQVNTRELILGILLEVNKEGQYSHLVIRSILEKYQYLEKQERAFITRVCEGTLEYKIRLDYILNQFSTVPAEKMKPVIRELLRSSVYQILYMDSVPDSAVCNEAVKLARKKGFYNLTGFVNGVLRKIAREYGSIRFPGKDQPQEYLSVIYSMPKWIVQRFLEEYGFEKTEKVLESFLKEKPTTIRIREYLVEKGNRSGEPGKAEGNRRKGTLYRKCLLPETLRLSSGTGCFSYGDNPGTGCQFHAGRRHCSSERGRLCH